MTSAAALRGVKRIHTKRSFHAPSYAPRLSLCIAAGPGPRDNRSERPKSYGFPVDRHHAICSISTLCTAYQLQYKLIKPAYDPIYYTAADVERLPVRIIGRVVELRAKY